MKRTPLAERSLVEGQLRAVDLDDRTGRLRRPNKESSVSLVFTQAVTDRQLLEAFQSRCRRIFIGSWDRVLGNQFHVSDISHRRTRDRRRKK